MIDFEFVGDPRFMTGARELGLKRHVLGTLESVFKRRRFGFQVENQTNRLVLKRDERVYFVNFEVVGITFSVKAFEVGEEETLFWDRLVFYDRFDGTKLPNLRKLGTTIANKLVNRPNWLVVHEVTRQ